MASMPTESNRFSPRWPRLTALAVALAVVIIVATILIPPLSILDKADLVGYAICHQIGERSFTIAGRQLPLCARCSGTFIGALLGLAGMLVLRRQRASQLPPPVILVLLLSFVAAWGFDGLNSYLTLFSGAPHLYEPKNWLRLTTGMLNGLALVLLVYPIWNFTLRRDTEEERGIKNLGELGVLLLVAAILIYLTQAEISLLLYPLVVLSGAGVLAMLTMVHSMIVAVILGREGYAQGWKQLAVPVSIGLGISLLQTALMVLGRNYLTTQFQLPF